MNTHRPTRSDRVEGLVRGMLAFALLAAVIWAFANGNGAPPQGLEFAFASLRG